MRSGDEPVHARSPLRLRLGLALFGLLAAAVSAAFLDRAGHRVPAVLLGLVALAALANACWVVVRIRQGPHFQPGSDIPPYRPLPDPARRHPADRRSRPSAGARQRTYLIMMAVCLALFALAGFVIRLYSPTLAAVVAVLAAAIAPIAAIVANAGWDGDPRGPDQDQDRGRGRDRSGRH